MVKESRGRVRVGHTGHTNPTRALHARFAARTRIHKLIDAAWHTHQRPKTTEADATDEACCAAPTVFHLLVVSWGWSGSLRSMHAWGRAPTLQAQTHNEHRNNMTQDAYPRGDQGSTFLALDVCIRPVANRQKSRISNRGLVGCGWFVGGTKEADGRSADRPQMTCHCGR